MRRKKLPKRKDKRIFRKTAVKSKKINVNPGEYRGGIRMWERSSTMLIRLYSVYDRVACLYADPFSSPNDATAARAFTIAQSNPESMLYASPQE